MTALDAMVLTDSLVAQDVIRLVDQFLGSADAAEDRSPLAKAADEAA